MIIGRNHLWFQIDQSCKNTVQRYGIGGHEDHVHSSRISGAGAIAFHGGDSVHDVKPGLHILVQVDEHPGEAVRAGVFGVTDGFILSIYKAVAILYCAGDPLQSVGFHLGKRNHTVCFQQFFRKDKLLRLDSIWVLHMHTLGVINGWDLVFLQIGVHSGTLDYLLRSSMAAGVRKYNILIARLAQNPGKGAHHHRVGDHSLLHFCFFQKVGL